MTVVSFLRTGDTPTQSQHVAMMVTSSLRLADVARDYVVTATTPPPYLTTEAGNRLLTEGGDLLTAES